MRGKKVSAAGQGKTLEISSGAVTFTTEHALRLRQRVEISLDWPAMLDSTCLKLVINGRVLRADADSATVAIEHYEFRTRAVRPGQSTAQASAAGAD